MNLSTLTILFAGLFFGLASNAAMPPGYAGKPFEDSVYKGGPQIIPGKIECAWFDLGGEGWPITTRTQRVAAAAG